MALDQLIRAQLLERLGLTPPGSPTLAPTLDALAAEVSAAPPPAATLPAPPRQPYDALGGLLDPYGGGALGGLLGLVGRPGRRAGLDAALSGQGRSSPSSGFSAAPPGRDFGGYDTSGEGLVTRQGVTGVPPAVRRLLLAERLLGVPQLSANVVSDYRTAAEQLALDPDQNGIGARGQAVAPVGSSYHEQGEAFDISSAWLAANPEVRPWLERHGFVWDVPGEPWHAHYVGGGAPIRAALRRFSRPDEPPPVRPIGGPGRASPPPAGPTPARRRRRGGYEGSAQQR